MILSVFLALLAVSKCEVNYKGVNAILLYAYPQLWMNSKNFDKIKHLFMIDDADVRLPNGQDSSLSFGRLSRHWLTSYVGLLSNKSSTDRIYVQSIDRSVAVNNTRSFLRGLLRHDLNKGGEEEPIPDIFTVSYDSDKLLFSLLSNGEAVKKSIDENKDQSTTDELESLRKSISSSFGPVVGFNLSFDEISEICEFVSHLNQSRVKYPSFISPQLLADMNKFCRIYDSLRFRNPNKLFKISTGGRFIAQVAKNFGNTEACVFGDRKKDPGCDDFETVSVYVTDKRDFMAIASAFAVNSSFVLKEGPLVFLFGLYSSQDKMYVRLASFSGDGVLTDVPIYGCAEYCLLSEFTRIHQDLMLVPDLFEMPMYSPSRVGKGVDSGRGHLLENDTQHDSQSDKKNNSTGSKVKAGENARFVIASNDTTTTTSTTLAPKTTTSSTTHSKDTTTSSTTHATDTTTSSTTHATNTTTSSTTHATKTTKSTTVNPFTTSTTASPKNIHSLRISHVVAWTMASVFAVTTCVLLFLYLKLRHLHYLGYRSLNEN